KKLNDYHSFLADEMRKFISYKRALGRKFETEAKALHLLDEYLLKDNVLNISDITSELLTRFLASRPRYRPRSYNHLLGVIKGFFRWLFVQGLLSRSPIHIRPRRATTQRIPFLFNRTQAQQLFSIASQLPDHNSAPQRGKSYFMM